MTPAPPAVEAALRRLFPDGVAVAAERVGPADLAALWPEERAAMAGAVPRRLADFAAGRVAARRVLATLGHPASALPMATDRAALWPGEIAGSIAHDAGLAVAVGRRGAPLGVDLETDAPIEKDLWPVICPDDGIDHGSEDSGRQVRRVFCAKEAVFKAQAPGERAMFGFEAVSVTLEDGGFSARFRQDAGGFRAGEVLRGRFAELGGMILAGVAR